MNKQIIIDDQKKTIHRLQDECTEKTNAIITLGEQLKAKEQECEELRGDLYFINEQLKDFKSHYDKAVEECEELKAMQKDLSYENQKFCYQIEEQTKQLDQLEAENENLKEIIQRHDNDNNALLSEFEDDLVEYYRRYKECLTEIKEIAEVLAPMTYEYDSCYYKDRCSKCEVKENCQYFKVEQILQKISECEANQ